MTWKVPNPSMREKKRRTKKICDDLGSIQYTERNKLEKSEGKVKLEGALPTARSKEIKTGFAHTRGCAPSWF